MADEREQMRQHVARLMDGTKAWNEWRERDPSPVGLFHPFLKFAQLPGANLAGVQTHYANFQEANLAGANLQGAGLGDAYLAYTDLTGANLRDAYLFRATFRRASLAGADFTNAFIGATDFLNLDLSQAIGLESCRFANPSHIDLMTLFRSGPLPPAFLRGCGLPEPLIAFLPSLLRVGPIQFYSCFISYSTANEDFARRLHSDLEGIGVRCWFAPHDMQPGQKIHEQIEEAIRIYDRLLLILSHESMASPWVKTEIAKARMKEQQQGRRVLFPITLVPFADIRQWQQFDADIGDDSAREIREYFIPDFSGWKAERTYKAALLSLLKALMTEE